MRKAGYSIVGAGTIAEATKLIDHCIPKLILLDLMLPGEDGLSVCRRLRAASSLPIILLTALFTGMVFSLQVGDSFRLFHAESLVGATVGMALAREIAPVFTSLMVVARAGSAMAAEIGTMAVSS